MCSCVVYDYFTLHRASLVRRTAEVIAEDSLSVARDGLVASQAAAFASQAGVWVAAISATANFILAASVANTGNQFMVRMEAERNVTRELNAAEMNMTRYLNEADRNMTRESREFNQKALIGGGVLVTIIAFGNKFF
jgi:hypothetical protein